MAEKMTMVKYKRTDEDGLCTCPCAWCLTHHREWRDGWAYRLKISEPGRCQIHARRREAPRPA